MIKNHCGVSDKIYGRNTELCIVETDKAKEFFEINHLQGHKKAKLYIGLKQNDILLSVGSFGIPNYSDKFDWEIIRFATLLNHSVLGGFSKILKYFQQENKGTIISYADREWSNGNVYEKNGFILDHITSPGYGWPDGGKVV